jgi:TolB protein
MRHTRHTFALVLTTIAALTLFMSGLVAFVRIAFATSGGEIAFESNRTGNWDIYLLDLQTGIMRSLTGSPADDLTPAWSPDGSQIAFVSDRDNDLRTELYVMNADGTNLRQLTNGERIDRDPFWTDARSLVYMHGWKQIYMMDVETGDERWLGTGFTPRLSPDGKSLLYYIEAGGSYSSHVYTIDLIDHHVTDLTAGTSHNWGGIWSPDGNAIAFMSNRGGKPNIFTVRPDGSSLTAITAGSNDLNPAWSPDGAQIIFASGDSGTMQLNIVNADGSNRRAVTATERDNNFPAWRPSTR